MIVLRLPVPPSVNNLFATNKRTGGRYKAPNYRRWQAQADLWFITQKAGMKPVRGPYSAEIKVPESTRADLDNLQKPILDYLVRVCLTDDDRNCQRVSIERAAVDCCEITVRAA